MKLFNLLRGDKNRGENLGFLLVNQSWLGLPIMQHLNFKIKIMNKTLNEFMKELELLKEEYIKRGYRDYNTADRQSYGQFVELSQILFELKKINQNK